MKTKTLSIALVDDDFDDRLFFKDAIDEIDIATDLMTFNHGQSFMDYLQTVSLSPPDLIFLDLNMPIKNGMECLKEIRATPAFKEVIIAIYSTSSSEQDIENTFVNGANIYINKPDSFKKLKRAIEKVLKINWQYQTSTLNKDNFLFRI